MIDRWFDVKERLPEFGAPVYAKVRHVDGDITYTSLVRVNESDCGWRTLDDNSELAHSWDVVQWRVADAHDKLEARHSRANEWLDKAIIKCDDVFTRKELMLEAVYQNCCLVHKNPTDFVNGIRRVLGEEVPQPPTTPTWCADALKAAGGKREPLFTPDGIYPYDSTGRYVELKGRVTAVMAPSHGKPYRLAVKTDRGNYLGRLDDVHLLGTTPHVEDKATIRVYDKVVDGAVNNNNIVSWSPVYLDDEPNYRRRESLTGED